MTITESCLFLNHVTLNANQSRQNSSNHNDDGVEELLQYRKKQGNIGPLPKRTRKQRRTKKTKPTKELYNDTLEAWERYSLGLLYVDYCQL
jgi:hypothetical protein